MRHFIFDLQLIDKSKYNDAVIFSDFLYLLGRLPITTLQTNKHFFEPHGLTAVALLAESHASIHTWPESGLICMDFFTCSKDKLVTPQEIISEIPWKHKIINMVVLYRGYPD
jgi:S-adenosylmethionine decarboxylase